eukprot:scaffold117838_cov75-Phaeocystis_antarctica.AAC.1
MPREGAHLVLVVVAQRLDDAPRVAQLAHERRVVVVRLDDGRGVGSDGRAAGLDEVGPQRALREDDVLGGEATLDAHGLRHAHEGVADDLALLLGRCVLGQRRRHLTVDLRGGGGEVGGEVYLPLDVDAHLPQRDLHARALLVPHEAVVDVQVDDPLGAQRLVEQRRAHRAVDAAAHEAEHLLMVGHVGSDVLDGGLLARLHGEGAGEAAHAEQEVGDHLAALDAQVHLRVELHAVHLPLDRLDGRGDVAGGGDDAEAVGHLVDAVAVREEHLRPLAQALEQRAAVHQIDLELPILALLLPRHGAAVHVVHELHAVADAEDWEPEREELRVVLGRVRIVHRLRPARDDDGRIARELSRINIQGQELALHAQLAHAAVDDLGVLRAGV